MEATPRRLLPLILAAFAVLALSYSVATRLKYGPDEPAHFIYIRSLATELAPPPISHDVTPHENSTSSHEGHQPPLYYAIMAVPFALLRAFGASDDTIWRVLRLANIPIGMLWIWSVYLLAREFFGKNGHAFATAAFVALIPTSAYTAGVINNENLISLVFTWAMIPILAYFKSGAMAPRSAAFTGLVVGLAILSKAQGLVLIPLFALAALAVSRRSGYANYRQVLATFAIVVGAAATVSGWWFARCWIVYGTLMPHSLYNPAIPGGLIALAVSPALAAELVFRMTEGLYGYFWVPFWLVWPFVGSLRPIVYSIGALNLVVLAGLVARIRRHNGVDRSSLAFVLAAPAIIYVLWLRYILVVDAMANLQGRLFLSVAAVVGMVWILGFDGLLKSNRAKRAGLVVGLVVMLAANVAVIACAVALYAS